MNWMHLLLHIYMFISAQTNTQTGQTTTYLSGLRNGRLYKSSGDSLLRLVNLKIVTSTVLVKFIILLFIFFFFSFNYYLRKKNVVDTVDSCELFHWCYKCTKLRSVTGSKDTT